MAPLILAAEPEPAMKRIEYRHIVPGMSGDAFGAKPKVLYVAGTTYSRTEELPDPAQGIHGLIIISEPDVWMVNLLSRQGRHMVDPGPTFVVHHNILDRSAPEVFSSLELGKEVEFFRTQKAAPLEAQTVEGKPCLVSEFRHGDYRLVLFVQKQGGEPVHLDIFKEGKSLASVRYLSYQTGLPFDASLFVPPAGVTIREAK
ncbi:MAG: hypothetical protein V4599_10110 [Verrucomicrobiota bacterium]